MGLFSRIGKAETNWRSRAWLASPRKTKLTILSREAKRSTHVPSGTNQEHKTPTQKTVVNNITNRHKSSRLIDDAFDSSIFASIRRPSCEHLGADLRSYIPEECYVCPHLIDCYSAVK